MGGCLEDELLIGSKPLSYMYLEVGITEMLGV